MRSCRIPRPVLVWMLLLLLSCIPLVVAAEKEAAEDVIANKLVTGCLHSKLLDNNKDNGLTVPLRVCNSEDPPNAASSGLICRPPEFDYTEIRIKCQDWESVIFGSWILQILLSEIAGVPTTVESGLPDTVMQYYDKDNRFDWGTTSNNLQAFRNAVELGNGDCRAIQQPPDVNASTYLNCAHVIPEVWTARSAQVQEYIREGILDPPIALGALGIEGWFIPKFTAEHDPSLTSWIGMAGEHNREKLAATFKRPTTWLDYCELVSPSNCTVPDPIAQQYPETEQEQERLFAEGLYNGHFRATEQNHCHKNMSFNFDLNSNSIMTNHNCTGHIGDFPCGWGGALQATTHWLNIALESNGQEPYSGGYTYSQLGQMWRAANATRSHVAMMWVSPDPIYEEFIGTDFEFVKVVLPPPTQSCLENKIDPENRCVEDPALRLGTSGKGVCDESARPLYKLMLSSLQQMSQNPSIPKAIQNPAHYIVSQFSLTELQINDIFGYWLRQPDEPREAICEWVVDNLSTLEQFIPRTFPRKLQDSSAGSGRSAVSIVSVVLGGLATLMVLVTGVMVYENSERRVLRYAQLEFLYMLLFGSAMVSVGAILTGLQSPSNATCVSQIWLISCGYTLVLVPLLVKVAAINRLMQAAQRMRRVKLDRKSLHGGVAVISLLVTIYLIVWTVIDPPQREAHYELTESQTSSSSSEAIEEDSDSDNNSTTTTKIFESTVVQVQYFCTSNSDAWQIVAIGWNVVLILCATALAFQSRNVKQHFNEATVLSRLIYGHFVFVLLRVMTLFFQPSLGVPALSIIYSLDTIFVLLIYFVPKFLADDQVDVIAGRTSTHSNSGAFSSRFGMNNFSTYRNHSTNNFHTGFMPSSMQLNNTTLPSQPFQASSTQPLSMMEQLEQSRQAATTTQPFFDKANQNVDINSNNKSSSSGFDSSKGEDNGDDEQVGSSAALMDEIGSANEEIRNTGTQDDIRVAQEGMDTSVCKDADKEPLLTELGEQNDAGVGAVASTPETSQNDLQTD